MSLSVRRGLHNTTYTIAVLVSVFNAPTLISKAIANDGISVKTTVPGIAIARLSKLPKPPEPISSATACNVLRELKTQGGSEATSLGWGVTGEAKLGQYDAVSFAGRLDQVAGSACEVAQGNVALFDGTELLAILYADKQSKLTIGRITAVKDRVRILDGGLVAMPVGEIRFRGDQTIEVDPLAPEEGVCDDKGLVPNVYGKPIAQARKQIMARGWVPYQSPPSSTRDPVGDDIRKTGIVEATDCSATDFAYCRNYYRQGHMELGVTTFGDDDPKVSDYAATCDQSSWHESN
ncbi:MULTISPECIES: hypothetical protein [Rhizobium]|uniref:Uncharacterized protein n=1 Tax=Rhizobium rhododendri TaxID=2506430 RepID=A0ABY8IQH3_9HYPH|nr:MULTISPECIES: hypothetical protein [Rhizobium]TQX85192.1 hypothetical protein EQW76_22465 [Rhizobium sp. rho-13.1]TQY09480.1 hypothetical protein EQW74_21670 [Rhizobium sp. rho-1.1]WFS25962.1 hypothetical protein PR018_20825 [Rhizobium rhododendri]